MDNSDNPMDNKEPIDTKDETQLPLPASDTPETMASEVETSKKSKFKLPKIKLNRNSALAISLAALLLLVGLFAFVLTRDNSTEESQNEVAVEEQEEVAQIGAAILIDEGTIQIVSNETGEWEDADTDTVIEQGSELKTVGAASRAVIGFDDGSALRLDANSEVIIDEMTTERIVVKHISGYTYNRVMPSESLTYVVTSEDAQYEALGTAFRTSTTGDEQSVEVYHSSVIETNTNKTPKEGEKLIVENKTTPTENGSIKKIDIEEVKNDPFMEWNRELDASDENYKDTLGFLSDVTPPNITLDKNDGDVVLLEPNASEGTIELSGKTESGARVTVESKSQSGSSPVDVSVAGDGSFKTPVLTAPIGNSVFEFIATDRVGNKSVKTLRVTFQRKSQPVAGNAVSFVLTAVENNSESKVEVNWDINNIEAPDGVKVVYGQSANPVFGSAGVEAVYIEKESSRSTTIKFSKFPSTGKYYIKACVYDKASGTCGQYSTQATIDIP